MYFEEPEEKEILKMFDNHSIDLNKLANLLDEVDLNKCEYEDYYRWSLLSQCAYNAMNEPLNVDWLDVFKLFKDKGLNFNFFGNTLIADLHYAITLMII